MKPAIKTCLLVLSVALVGSSTSRAADWTTFQHDKRHTGVSGDERIGVPMRLAWTFATNGPVRVQPVVRGGVVYFGSTDQKFYAVDARTGELKWSRIVGGPVMSTAAVGNEGKVYFGCDDGCVYALDAATGRIVWASPVLRTPPPDVPAEQFLRSEQPLIPPWASDTPIAMGGEARPTRQVIWAPVVVHDGMVFAGSGRSGDWGHLHGFDAETGRLCWSRPSSVQGTYRIFGGVESAPVVFRGILFWPEYMIEALDPLSGRNIPGWPETMIYRVGTAAFSFPNEIAVSPEGLAIAYVYARHFPHSGVPARWYPVDLADNSVRFVNPLGSTRPQLDQSAVVEGGRMYVVQLEPKVAGHPAVVCFDYHSGRWICAFEQPEGKPFNGPLAQGDGLIFGVTQDGVIYALRPDETQAKLEKIWSHDVGAAVYGSAAIAEGAYIVGAEDGRVRAFVKESNE